MLPGGGPRFSGTTLGEHGPLALGAGRRPVLAIGGQDDGRVQLRDAATGRRLATRKLGRGGMSTLAFSPRGRVLAAVHERGLTVLSSKGTTLGAFPAAGAEYGAAPLDELGRTAAIGTTGQVLIRTPGTTEAQFARPLESANELTTLAFDPTGHRIAAVDTGERVRLWDAGGGGPSAPR